MTLKKSVSFGSALLGVAVAGLCLVMTARAQQVDDIQKIVAVVNDEIVSEYDVEERMNLIESTTGQARTAEEKEQLRKTVIELLIDEKLQLQEARELEAKISMEQVEERYAELAQRNGASVRQFDMQLARMGASKQTILAQMQASMAWEEVVNARLRPFLAIGENEVNAYLERLTSNKGEPEYRIGEIFLGFDTPEQERETRQTAERLVRQIREGSDFQAVANQFSDLATGAVGGDMGWLIAEQMPTELRQAVLGMREGQVTDPIRVAGGYYIYALRDERRVMSADPDEAEVELSQIIVRADEAALEAQRARIEQQASTIRACTDIPAIAGALGAWDFGSIGKSRLGDLQPVLKEAVRELDTGEASAPFKVGADYRVLVLCGKTEPEVREPSFTEIEDFLSNQKLGMMARRYLRDLRRDAIIDYR